ncbi:MAG: hypothetical protein FIA99_02615, partial [Ruminiclostridium sp.]|nr:hypothetical protein [Ruminiclostridium sp.]
MEKIEKFNVIWNTPGSGSPDSMPAGNGDIGVNVWTEENGDLLFYISKTDTWNENMRRLNIGRMRVSFKPGLNVKNMSFSQKLDFCQGSISICTGQPEMEIVIWVDANRPVIHLDIRGSNPFETEAVLEVWRTSERRLEGQELHSSYAMCDSPEPVIELPDVVVENQDDRVIWYHRNEASIWDATMRLQGLQDIEERYDDPLLHLTFGCAVKGTGLANIDSRTLKTIKPLKECHISLYPLTMHADTIQAWTEALEKNIVRMESSDFDIARGEH